MLTNMRMLDAITIRDRLDLNSYKVSDLKFDALLSDGGNALLLESWNLSDFEAVCFYDTDIAPAENMLLEAITTSRARISQTMRAFIRSLNQGLKGTDITAGIANGEPVEDGMKLVGGAEIGKARRTGNLALLPARIPLSDGQSVTIVFHSPSGDTTKISAQDTLVAFRFYLNKRDVTHAVAPMNGRDISLKQTTQMLANLIERNSEKFQRSREKNARLLAQITEANTANAEQQNQITALIDAGDELLGKGKQLDTDYEKYRKLADKQHSINEALEKEITSLKFKKPNPVPGGSNITPPTPAKPDVTNDTRAITENLESNGAYTLSNGAKIRLNNAVRGDDLVGFVTITEPDGKVYSIDSSSPATKTMMTAARSLIKAYRDGKADKYKVNEMVLNGEAQAQVEAAVADLASAKSLEVGNGWQAITRASKSINQARLTFKENGLLGKYEKALEEADEHLLQIQSAYPRGAMEIPRPARYIIPDDMPQDLKTALQYMNDIASQDMSVTPPIEEWKAINDKLSAVGKILYANDEYKARYDDDFQILAYFVQEIAGALADGSPIIVTPTPAPTAPEPLPTTVTPPVDEPPAAVDEPPAGEVSAEIAGALKDIQDTAALENASLEEIKAHIQKLRAAYAVLSDAGVIDTHQAAFDAASQHLGDLMQQIAKG